MPAYNHLGQMYFQGVGVSKDRTEAARWFHKGAVAGDPRAQGNYGILHFDGLGVPKNPEEGLRWLREAARNGDRQSREMLQKKFGENW